MNFLERARQIFERESRHETTEAREDRRLAAFDVDLDERGDAELLDQTVERRGVDLDLPIPLHALEIRSPARASRQPVAIVVTVGVRSLTDKRPSTGDIGDRPPRR